MPLELDVSEKYIYSGSFSETDFTLTDKISLCFKHTNTATFFNKRNRLYDTIKSAYFG